MCDFMAEETHAGFGARARCTLAEHDMRTDRERPGADRVGRPGSRGAFMHLHAGEIRTEAALETSAHVLLERCSRRSQPDGDRSRQATLATQTGGTRELDGRACDRRAGAQRPFGHSIGVTLDSIRRPAELDAGRRRRPGTTTRATAPA